MLAIGAIFLFESLDAVPEQPIMLVIVVIAAGVVAGAGVVIWRAIRYGRGRPELDTRGDPMRGVITMSGSGWAAAGCRLGATVELVAIQSFGKLKSLVVARAPPETLRWLGKDITPRPFQ